MKSSVEQMDKSKHKLERRRIIHEITALQQSFLATDYPGSSGREFIRQLHRDRKDLAITLVNKSHFQRDFPGDSLKDVVTKIRRKDIFDVIQHNTASIVDIDLFGGLSIEHWKKVETAPYWTKMLLTFTKVFRHRTKKGLLKSKEDPALFMEMWCQEAGWKPPIMAQLPYRRPNKNAILGIVDIRGPQYWTFLLER